MAEGVLARISRRRRWLDRLSRYSIGFAGISVMLSLAAIFIYLFSQIIPLLYRAEILPQQQYQLSAPLLSSSPLLSAALHTDNQTLVALNRHYQLQFYAVHNGGLLRQETMPLAEGTDIVALTHSVRGRWLFGLSDGRLLLLDWQPDGLPQWQFYEGSSEAVARQIAIQETEQGPALLRYQPGLLQLLKPGTDEWLSIAIPEQDFEVAYLMADRQLRHVLVVSAQGKVLHFQLTAAGAELMQQRLLLSHDQYVTTISWLAGGQSLLVGDSAGIISQWAFAADPQGTLQLTMLRQFKHSDTAIRHLLPEYQRRGFVALDDNGLLALYHSTAESRLLQRQMDTDSGWPLLNFTNQQLMLLSQSGYLQMFKLRNLHPEVSWRSLWMPVWYEGWQQPEHVWQSAGGSDEYEPKLSLVPLLAGTMKAAFFALLFAVPLALMAAIYTAHFMAAGLRRRVKPALEMLESLPTVILGLIAGLWLAPFVEQHLLAVFALVLVLPLTVLIVARVWQLLPGWSKPPQGYEILVLLPVLACTVWGTVQLMTPLELWLFGDSLRYWLSNHGVNYDQRNALVVGIALGVAVIPVIFAIAEDAVFNVPRHLYQGALALGATPWQALSRTVLPLAAPGMFSAVMIGFGRATGETMIVLMATGNNPVSNFNLLEGLRSLAASLAIELPEAAAGGSQFRILFLAAVLLFIFTFCANTVAELVRQRLRRQYRDL